MKLTFSQRLICFLAYIFVWLLHRSYRYRWYRLDCYEKAQKLSARANPVVACWHQNALASALAHEGRRLAIVVSQSFDGEVISSVVKRFGIESARGSSNRGGLEALRGILKYAKNGWDAGITVDGPKGPVHKAKAGVIAIASLSEAAIVPLAAIGWRTWSFKKSWDRFRLPKPFSPIICLYGDPIFVPKKAGEAEEARFLAELEETLMRLEAEVESWRLCGSLPRAEHKGLRQIR